MGTAGCIAAGEEQNVLRVGGGCLEDGAYVYLTNDNDEPVDMRLTGPDGYAETRTVGGSAGDANRFDALADGAYELESLHDDYRPSETSFEFHCEEELAVTRDCVERDGRITVGNHNDEPVDVRVTGPDGYDETGTVGGSEQIIRFSGLADGEYHLEALDERFHLERSSVVVDCPD